MTKKSAPAAAVAEEQPQQGGSYVRLPGGSLELVHRTEEHPGDPASDDAPAPAEDDVAPDASAPGNGGAE